MGLNVREQDFFLLVLHDSRGAAVHVQKVIREAVP